MKTKCMRVVSVSTEPYENFTTQYLWTVIGEVDGRRVRFSIIDEGNNAEYEAEGRIDIKNDIPINVLEDLLQELLDNTGKLGVHQPGDIIEFVVY